MSLDDLGCRYDFSNIKGFDTNKAVDWQNVEYADGVAYNFTDTEFSCTYFGYIVGGFKFYAASVNNHNYVDGVCTECGNEASTPDTPEVPDTPEEPDTPDIPDVPDDDDDDYDYVERDEKYWIEYRWSGKEGWQKAGNKEYYLDENGKCLMNTTTPDGVKVDETGAKIG